MWALFAGNPSDVAARVVSGARVIHLACLARSVMLCFGMVLLGGVSNASADPKDLAQAKQKLAAVRYDDAQALLTRAIRAGGLSRDKLIEAYLLSGITALVLGHEEVAETYFAKALSLDIHVKLPGDPSPKIREAFANAAARAVAVGALNVEAVYGQRGTHLVLRNDPSNLVVSARRRQTPTAARIPIAEPIMAQIDDELLLFDVHGNELAVVAVRRPAGADLNATVTTSRHASRTRAVLPWALGSVGLAAGGVTLGILSQREVRQRDAAVTARNYLEARAADDRARNLALGGNVAFALAGASALAGLAVMWFTPSATTAIAPQLTPTTVGISGRW